MHGVWSTHRKGLVTFLLQSPILCVLAGLTCLLCPLGIFSPGHSPLKAKPAWELPAIGMEGWASADLITCCNCFLGHFGAYSQRLRDLVFQMTEPVALKADCTMDQKPLSVLSCLLCQWPGPGHWLHWTPIFSLMMPYLLRYDSLWDDEVIMCPVFVSQNISKHIFKENFIQIFETSGKSFGQISGKEAALLTPI